MTHAAFAGRLQTMQQWKQLIEQHLQVLQRIWSQPWKGCHKVNNPARSEANFKSFEGCSSCKILYSLELEHLLGPLTCKVAKAKSDFEMLFPVSYTALLVTIYKPLELPGVTNHFKQV